MLYQPYAALRPSRDDSAYILTLVPAMADSLAAITSANELLVVDRQNLSSAQTSFFDGALDGSNCLVAGDPHGQTLLCSSIYGTVATFDVRTQRKVSYFNLGMVHSRPCHGLRALTDCRPSCDRSCQLRIDSSCRH